MFTVKNSAIVPDKLRQKNFSDEAGGYASFEGWVRNHNDGRAVDSLEYVAYDTLAKKEGTVIIEEALELFPIIAAHCEHRTGHLKIGELAVCICVSAAHRSPAFEACRYIIDQIKKRVPIWKKEHYSDGSAGWPHCKKCSNPEDVDNCHH